jgi:PhnB protein
MAGVTPVPDGYHSVTPYLIIDGASEAIDFYTKVFDATERMRLPMPGGRVGHAELEIGDSVVMLADEAPEMGIRSATTIGGSPVNLHLYLDDVDAVFARAIAAGAEPLQPVEDKFYGDRSGQLRDPFGHIWSLATHVEDVAPGEMERRMDQLTGGQGAG